MLDSASVVCDTIRLLYVNQKIMKRALLLGSAVLLLGAGCATKPLAAPQQTTQATVQQNNTMGDPAVDDMMQNNDVFVLQSDTSVSYVVQKEWFGKPSETVVGTSNDVSGSVDYDANGEILQSVNLSMQTASFDSGSGGRDKDVAGMLGEQIQISLANSVAGIAPGTVSVTIPLDVTINGQTNTVDFDVTGIVSDTMIDVTGKATANITDFGVKAPSILNVYSVAEEMNLNFELKAKK